MLLHGFQGHHAQERSGGMAGNVLHHGVVRSLDRRRFRTDSANLRNESRRPIFSDRAVSIYEDCNPTV